MKSTRKPFLRNILWIPSSILGLLLFGNPLAAQERGYQARACGLDMNRNGVIGEPAGEDPLTEPGDCNVCDGGPNHPTHPETGTPDPDGDGVFEDLIYVDAQNGNDTTGDGSALSPYRSLTFAWSQGDGLANNIEDIVCFRGITTESSMTPPEGYQGLPETYVVPATGSQVRDWHFPSQPTMLVGWDFDDDGCYPPFDDGSRDTAACGTTADTALLNGNSTSSIRAFHLASDIHHFEVAHLTINNYGRRVTDTSSGFIKFGNLSEHNYLYFHDLELNRINGDRSHVSSIIAIDIFNTNPHWLNFSNILFNDNGGWLVRGVPHQSEQGQADAGPLRWQNITRIMKGDDDGATNSFKPWGYISRAEVLDSVFDMNTEDWTPLPGTGNATITFLIVQCNQDWVIRNNEIIDFWGGFRIDGSADGACENETARPTTDIVIDRNIFRNTYDLWDFGHFGISVQGEEPGDTEGDAPGEVIGNVTISNNILYSVGDGTWESCIAADPSNDAAPVPGAVKIVNNTCIGEIRRDEGAAILIGSTVDGAPDHQNFLQQNYVVKNNLIADLRNNDHNVVLGYLPTGWESDHNVFDGSGKYALWTAGSLIDAPDLAGWGTTVGGEGASAECDPLFVNRAQGDFHLSPLDTCASSAGEILGDITEVDVDGDPRPTNGSWAVGADEFSAIFNDGFESGDRSAWSNSVP